MSEPDRIGLFEKAAKRCPLAESRSLKILQKPISISCANASVPELSSSSMVKRSGLKQFTSRFSRCLSK